MGRSIIDLTKQNLFFEQSGQTIKLLNIKPSTMNIQVAIWKKEIFIKNSTMAFAHIPKKLKAKINPLC